MECLGTAGWGPVCVHVSGTSLTAGDSVVQSSWGQARKLSRGGAALLHSRNLQKLLHYSAHSHWSPLPVCAPEPLRFPHQGLKIVKKALPVDHRESRTAPPSASPLPLARGCNSPLNALTGIEAGPPGCGTVLVTCIKLFIC